MSYIMLHIPVQTKRFRRVPALFLSPCRSFSDAARPVGFPLRQAASFFPAWDVFYRRKMYQSTKQNFIAKLLIYLCKMIDFMTLCFSLICICALIGTSCGDPNRSWCFGVRILWGHHFEQ